MILEIRDGFDKGEFRAEKEFPLARTEYPCLYLNAKTDSLDEECPTNEWRVKYDGLGSGPGKHRAEFDFVFEEKSEITGYASARLFMESPKSEDMHVFITLWKLDKHMEPVGMTYYAQVTGPGSLLSILLSSDVFGDLCAWG